MQPDPATGRRAVRRLLEIDDTPVALAIRVGIVVGVSLAGTALVYLTGGTHDVYPHFMYIGVALAGVWFGRVSGLLTGAAAGVLVGPLMPLDVAAGTPQTTAGWMIRLGFFVIVGWVAGHARHRFDRVLAARRDFVTSVSHELRTPMSVVFGFADLLHTQWPEIEDSERREFVALIRKESAEVNHVVDDLLVAARLAGGRITIDPDEIELRDVAESVVSSLPEEVSRNRVRIEGRGRCIADPLRTRQIVRNIVTNAFAHGGEHISVRIESSRGEVVATISDDGSGVPDIIVPRLFEPFTSSAYDTSKPQSVGLGLAVSRELARRMGGHLSYERRDGWTYFHLHLPAASTIADRVEPGD